MVRASPHKNHILEISENSKDMHDNQYLQKNIWKHASMIEAWYFSPYQFPLSEMQKWTMCVMCKSHTWLNWYSVSNKGIVHRFRQNSFFKSSLDDHLMINTISIVSCKRHQMAQKFLKSCDIMYISFKEIRKKCICFTWYCSYHD